MRSPALAIAWEFRRRHRWGLIAVAGYLFIVATIRFLILEPGEPVLVDSVRFAAMVSVPLTTTFVYLLAVFSFGFSGDLAARHSMYPVRMFTLPVTNAALVGWTFGRDTSRSEEHTSELQSRLHLVCRLLLEKKKKKYMYKSQQ